MSATRCTDNRLAGAAWFRGIGSVGAQRPGIGIQAMPRYRYGRVYFVSVDYNSITGLTTKTFSQKFSICAAVAAAAAALRAAGLGTAARGTPPRQRRPHTLKILRKSFRGDPHNRIVIDGYKIDTARCQDSSYLHLRLLCRAMDKLHGCNVLFLGKRGDLQK